MYGKFAANKTNGSFIGGILNIRYLLMSAIIDDDSSGHFIYMRYKKLFLLQATHGFEYDPCENKKLTEVEFNRLPRLLDCNNLEHFN